jgi:hypothetical protein
MTKVAWILPIGGVNRSRGSPTGKSRVLEEWIYVPPLCLPFLTSIRGSSVPLNSLLISFALASSFRLKCGSTENDLCSWVGPPLSVIARAIRLRPYNALAFSTPIWLEPLTLASGHSLLLLLESEPSTPSNGSLPSVPHDLLYHLQYRDGSTGSDA